MPFVKRVLQRYRVIAYSFNSIRLMKRNAHSNLSVCRSDIKQSQNAVDCTTHQRREHRFRVRGSAQPLLRDPPSPPPPLLPPQPPQQPLRLLPIPEIAVEAVVQ